MSLANFAKSAVGLFWSVPILATEGVVRAITTKDESTKAQSGVDRIGDGLKKAFLATNEVQSTLVEDALDPKAWSGSCDTHSGAGLMALPWSTIKAFIPGLNGSATWGEYRNKVQVFITVPGVARILDLPDEEPYPTLADANKKAYEQDEYIALWAVEGLGHYWGDVKYNPGDKGLLSDDAVTELEGGNRDPGLTMLNAGIGLAIAVRHLSKINHVDAKSDYRRVIEEIVKANRENATPGYEGCAIESLGLVTRQGIFSGDTRPDLAIGIVREVLEEIGDAEARQCFSHGAGRAVYFHAANFLPVYGSIWHGLQMVCREAPDEESKNNAIAGLIWGVTTVNIRSPRVMLNLIEQYGDQLGSMPAFKNGLQSSMVMREDTTPGAEFTRAFYEDEPKDVSGKVLDDWKRLVAEPAREAVEVIQPMLRYKVALGEVFRYHEDLRAFAEGLPDAPVHAAEKLPRQGGPRTRRT